MLHFLEPQFPEGNMKGPHDACAYSGSELSWQRFKIQMNFLANSVLQERNTEFREPDVFIMVIIICSRRVGGQVLSLLCLAVNKSALCSKGDTGDLVF